MPPPGTHLLDCPPSSCSSSTLRRFHPTPFGRFPCISEANRVRFAKISHFGPRFPATMASQSRAIQSVLAGDKDISAGKTDVSASDAGLRGKLNKVVLAYSGGLDTSVIVPWLRENYGCDVVCFTADVGQGVMEMEGLEAKAKASGASQLVVKDLKEEFVRDFIYPCLRAGAIYERKYLLGTSMARPVIAKLIDIWCLFFGYLQLLEL